MKNTFHIVLIVASCLLAPGQALASEAAGTSCAPHLNAERWSSDVRHFAAELVARHRNPYHLITKQEFDRKVGGLLADIPRLPDYRVLTGLHALAASIGDGHTFVSISCYRRYPLDLFWYADGLRVTRADASIRQVAGSRLVAIDGIPIGEVDARLQRFIPQAESAWYRRDASAKLATRAEPLMSLGLAGADGTASFTFARDVGEPFVLSIEPSAAMQPADGGQPPLPLHMQHADEPFWFTYLADSRLVYVDFRSFRDLEENAKRLLAFLPDKDISKIVIDLRHNGGGNYAEGRTFLIEPLLFWPALKSMKLNRSGRLFVIIGRETFSAGMTIATDFRRETEATLVGEPTGARPTGYQENDFFALPNSKLNVSVASMRYRFDPRDLEAVFPDQRVDPDWRMDRLGQDAALAWIVDQPHVEP